MRIESVELCIIYHSFGIRRWSLCLVHTILSDFRPFVSSSDACTLIPPPLPQSRTHALVSFHIGVLLFQINPPTRSRILLGGTIYTVHVLSTQNYTEGCWLTPPPLPIKSCRNIPPLLTSSRQSVKRFLCLNSCFCFLKLQPQYDLALQKASQGSCSPVLDHTRQCFPHLQAGNEVQGIATHTLKASPSCACVTLHNDVLSQPCPPSCEIPRNWLLRACSGIVTMTTLHKLVIL